MNWNDGYRKLQEVLREADSFPPALLAEKIAETGLADHITKPLIASVRGDYRAVNRALYEQPLTSAEPVVWLAPVVGSNGKTRYAWTIATRNPLMAEVAKRMDSAILAVRENALLAIPESPPPLFFLDPLEVSRLDAGSLLDVVSSGFSDELAIFQVGYPNQEGTIRDIDQRMLLNTRAPRKKVENALARAAKVFEGLGDDRECIRHNRELFVLLHAEGHNRGHFMGPWPLGPDKESILYEACEELRACLAAVTLVQHAGFSREEVRAFANMVFLVRFLGYGFEASLRREKSRGQIREISIGCMLFELLVEKGAIQKGKMLTISPEIVLSVCLQTLLDMNKEEGEQKTRGRGGLQEIARKWYHRAYPGQLLSPTARDVYATITAQ